MMDVQTAYLGEEAPLWVRAISLVARSLRTFAWRAKITPAMRERCVRYAVDAGARGNWEVTRQAQMIAEFIAKGEK